MIKQLKSLFLLILLLSNVSLEAFDTPYYDTFAPEQRAKILELTGRAWVLDQAGQGQELKLGDYLYTHQTVITDQQAHLILNFQANGLIALNETSKLSIGENSSQNFQHLHLSYGHLLSFENPKLKNRAAGLLFSVPEQDQLFHAQRMEIVVEKSQTKVFVQKGQLTRIKLTPPTSVQE